MGLLDQVQGAVVGAGKPDRAYFTIQIEKAQSGDPKKPLSNLGDPIACQFNPASLALSKKISWTTHNPTQSSPGYLVFGSEGLQSLSFDLYFDTTEPTKSGDSPSQTDVRELTNKIMSATQFADHLHRTPVCSLSWGGTDTKGNNLFNGVATSISQSFTFFSAQGVPLRAKLQCQFTGLPRSAYAPADQPKSNDLNKAYVVQRGDTLASIARNQMHDVTFWRLIALANGITDPLALQPGLVLQIPTAG